MKKIQLLFALLFISIASSAQNVSKEKWVGLIGTQKATLEFSIKTTKGASGFEETITYKGTLTIGAKKIPLTGEFEGNTMRFMQMVNGKKTETLNFDLSSEEGTYKVNGKTSKVQLTKK